MADDRDDRERFSELEELIMAAHGFLRVLFEELPVPVVVIGFDAETDDHSEVLLSLDRARHLIEDEPIPSFEKKAISRLVLDWFSATEMLVLTKLAGPAPWRMDSVEYALHRFIAVAEMIERGELDDDES
ncbi:MULTISPECIES: hypothetical protein [Streptomycetaceae]|uniref:hypothetical protein n=1 Tax=Streptomycetaceae TaxID=2062 RepID=UPI00036A7B96|nr:MULTISPECIES: hypothetical protein [Streptomycetaceae]